MRIPVQRLAWWLALGAGSIDFCSGLGLAFVPAQVLPLMGVDVPGAEALIWLRWVGAFVWAVGASYLLALVLGGEARLRTLPELTIPLRLSAVVFSAVAVASGWLSLGWTSVTATDFSLVIAQMWLLRKWPTTRLSQIRQLKPQMIDEVEKSVNRLKGAGVVRGPALLAAQLPVFRAKPAEGHGGLSLLRCAFADEAAGGRQHRRPGG